MYASMHACMYVCMRHAYIHTYMHAYLHTCIAKAQGYITSNSKQNDHACCAVTFASRQPHCQVRRCRKKRRGHCSHVMQNTPTHLHTKSPEPETPAHLTRYSETPAHHRDSGTLASYYYYHCRRAADYTGFCDLHHLVWQNDRLE